MPWDSDFGKLVGEHENYLEDLFVNKNTTNIEIEEKKDESFSDEYDFIPDPIWGKSNEDVEENETQSAVVEQNQPTDFEEGILDKMGYEGRNPGIPSSDESETEAKQDASE